MLNGAPHHEDDPEPTEFTVEELTDAAPRCTDAGNADAFVLRHGEGFRFVTQWGAWLAWNGRRWEMIGAEGRAFQAALLSAREDYAITKLAVKDLDEELRQALLKGDKDVTETVEARLKYQKALLKWHEQSQNVSRLNATLKVLSSALVVAHTELDTHPWLLNCQNGTVDLRTGELHDHQRADLLTQIAPVDFDPEATCPTWEKFLTSSLAGNYAVVLYLQRLIGYAATGLTTEHLLLFFLGGGSNGKSTFFTAVLDTLGDDYACAAPPDLLMMPRGAGAPHPTEVASLYGKRVATCAETGEGQRLDEAKVKRLTGGDPIRTRRMNEDFWSFAPTHTCFASGQYKPTITGADHGIWRRVKVIPWNVQIAESEMDKGLPAKLKAEHAGILAWIVQGCLEWQKIGLAEPEIVSSSTAAYRQSSDVLGQFLASTVVRDPDGRVSKRRLRGAYEVWAKDEGNELLGGRRFNERIRDDFAAVPCKVRETANGMPLEGWRGIRLKTDRELYDESEPSSGAELS